MSIRISEKPDSRRVTVSLKNPSAEFKVTAYADGGETSDQVRDAIIAWLPKWYGPLVLLLDDVEIEPQPGRILTYATAKYGMPDRGVNPTTGESIDGQGDETQPPDPPQQSGTQTDQTMLGPEYSWETAGGTKKLQKSIEVISSHVSPAIGGTPPDIKGAIGLSKDGIEGVEVPDPRFSWSVTYEFAFITRQYLRTLRNLTGTVNRDDWQGRKAREVRFDGSSGRICKDGKVEVTFRFSEQNTQTSIGVGDMTIPEVKGFDYLDIGYGPDVDQSFPVDVPQRAYVHKIYIEADFTELGIG